ncbi:MAG: phytanoyl-CoA dioxygenase family protein [Pseudomonadota bacterium]
MTSRLLRPICDDEVEAFRNDGVVCLRGAFSLGWVERLAAATEEVLAQPSQRHIEAPVTEGRFSVDTYVWMHNGVFRDYAFESPAAAIAARLLDARHVSLLYDQVLVKEPGTDTPTSWHQDGASWPLNGEDALTLWMPHATGDNCSASVRRRAHTTRWVSERCTFREGDFQLRPVGDHGLKDGDPLHGDHFPRVPVERNW